MVIKGVGIGRGAAVAPVLHMAPALPEPADEPRDPALSTTSEKERIAAAMKKVQENLMQRSQAAAQHENTKEAAPILAALSQMAVDPALTTKIDDGVDSGKTADRATYEGFSSFEQQLHALGGYMAERAGDLRDVGQRVIALLTGAAQPGIPESDTPYVLVAQDLSPADTAALDLDKVQAIVTAEGGPTSHTAILARSRGIVAVVAAAGAQGIPNGTLVAVNAATGEVIPDPSDTEIAQAHKQNEAVAKAATLRGKPGALKDGTLLPLLANVGKPEDGAQALKFGAEGVGLFRTEFLFLSSEEAPSVEVQAAAYEKLLAQFPGKKVVIRLLDAGADKPLAFLTPEDEPNPALGVRGLRALRVHKNILEDQLEALARADAATEADLWVMAPMVADAPEAKYFTDLGHSYGLKKVGVMAEVPSIAIMADQVAKVTDFVSIGTNDLTQYTLAADRTLGSVSHYQTVWHPAVLRAIKMIADAGAAQGMPVGVCGEAAADPQMAVVLAGVGVTSLSMSAASLDAVRAELAEHTLAEAQEKAAAALDGAQYKPYEPEE
ncbi:MAG: phosphoenolpyruvate--protein phosphotransferase [Bifidobacteriaceae bacterium]|nr:phosphoenolpyruvate--protein phosphotransferase [Bifidobacteriaceae bacterium]MCI1978211.1 phosphoenolpyruvate--protein phosphotransferase [Bifidobacteriaceae bacterium]